MNEFFKKLIMLSGLYLLLVLLLFTIHPLIAISIFLILLGLLVCYLQNQWEINNHLYSKGEIYVRWNN